MEAVKAGKQIMGYVQLNDTYRLKENNANLGQVIQYATYYFLRLAVLKEKVIEAAKKKWRADEDYLSYVKDILDIKYNTKTVIAGTLYKEMVKKPCILKLLDGVGNQRIIVQRPISLFLRIHLEE